MITKGRLSPLLDAILSDPVESKKLREAIATGKDYVVELDGIHYRITTSAQSAPKLSNFKIRRAAANGELQPG